MAGRRQRVNKYLIMKIAGAWPFPFSW